MAVKYLVSGGEGALGKTVISMLLQRGEKVRILMSELSDTRIYRNNPNIEICYGISTDKDSMIEFFDLEDPRSAVLFHTDEYVSLSDSTNLTMRRVNVIGAENIVDMCLKRKVGKLVYLSSAYALNPEVKGEDLTIHFDRNKVEGEYAKSKAEAAAYVMEKVSLNRLNAVMVLPTFIIGPGYSEDYEINKVLNSYLNNGTIPPKEGGRAFVDVRDVANAMLALADKGEPGAGYIVSGDYKTSGEFFKDVNEISGNDAPVKTASKLVMSKSLAKLVDFYYKITHKENPKQAYTLFSDNPDARFEDNSKGILPELTISFKDSLKDTIEGAQRGGVQAAAAASPKAEKKPDAPQAKVEKKSSAEAMEARLKQQQNVASRASSATAGAGEAAGRPAHTRPATAAAMAAKAKAEEEAKKEEENKSIAPLSTLKDPDAMSESEKEEKKTSETTFRFGGTPTKFTRIETPKTEPAKSILPQSEPKTEAPASKAEPAKSIIPPKAPATSGFPRAGFAKPAAPAAPKAEPAQPINSAFKAPGAADATPSPFKSAPKAEEAPKAPASSGFPRAGFAKPAAPAAPKAEPAQPINSAFKAPGAADATPSPFKSAPKAEEAPKAPASSGFPRAAATPSSGFPRAAATPSSAPKSEPVNSAFKPAESKPAEPKASASSGFPRAAATPSSGFPRAAATPSSAPKSEPVNSAFKPAESKPAEPKASASSGFPRAAATPSSGASFLRESTKPAPTIGSAFTANAAAKPDDSSPFKPAKPAVPKAEPGNPFGTRKETPDPAPKAEPAKPAFGATYNPIGNSATSAKEPSVDDLFNDLEKEIEDYAASEGPVVPPGIFAPPPKPGQ